MTLLGLVVTLVIDTAYSWERLLIALAISIAVGMVIGIWAAISTRAENILVPLLDVGQTLPILTFFPFVVFVIVAAIPGSAGIGSAVVFLIITSMIWNISFGAYEAVKALPNEVFEVSKIYGMSAFDRIRKIYIPASMPKVLDQSMLSWSIGLFYLVTSEIFSTGTTMYQVKHGIGVELTKLALSGNFVQYLIGIIVFLVFVILTRFLLFRPLRTHFNKFNERHMVKAWETKKLLSERELRDIETAVKRRVPQMDVRPSHLPMRSIGVLASSTNKKILRAPVTHKPGIKKKKPLPAGFRFTLELGIVIAAVIAAVFIKNFVHDESIVLSALITSIARVWLAFALVLVIAIPLSVYLLFMSKRTEQYLLVFQILASIPATILLPLIVSLARARSAERACGIFHILPERRYGMCCSASSADRSYIQNDAVRGEGHLPCKGLQRMEEHLPEGDTARADNRRAYGRGGRMERDHRRRVLHHVGDKRGHRDNVREHGHRGAARHRAAGRQSVAHGC